VTAPAVATQADVTVPVVTSQADVTVPVVTSQADVTVPVVTSQADVTVPAVASQADVTVPAATTQADAIPDVHAVRPPRESPSAGILSAAAESPLVPEKLSVPPTAAVDAVMSQGPSPADASAPSQSSPSVSEAVAASPRPSAVPVEAVAVPARAARGDSTVALQLDSQSPLLTTYCVERRIVIADGFDAINMPLPTSNLAGFLAQRIKGPYTLAAGDFSSDDEDDDSDDSDDSDNDSDDGRLNGRGATAAAMHDSDSDDATPLYGSGFHPRDAVAVRFGALTVLRWGRIVRCRPGYHTSRLLFPVGYRAVRIFWGPHRPSERSPYLCDIVPREDDTRSAADPPVRGRLAGMSVDLPPLFVITSAVDSSLRVTGSTPDGDACVMHV
jgi:hypothetical protein